MTAPQNRERIIFLPGGITNEQADSIFRKLQEIEAVTKIEINGLELKIQYIFPLLSFSMIWKIINAHTGTAVYSLADKFKYSLIAYMENIEGDRLRSHSGWEKYIQDIYVSHYHQLRTHQAGQKRKQWQQYKPVKPDN